jgi:hypothetical protein
MTAVIHHARLAWDGAMAFVGASAHPDLYGWLAERLTDVLGPIGGEALAETRVRLTHSRRPDAPQVESGRWRARLEDVLDAAPELSGPLGTLINDTRLRLREVQPQADVMPWRAR